MDTLLANWGIELAFFRTKVGREFQVIQRINGAGAGQPLFFGTYGYFDLLAIRCLESLALPSLVPLDPDLLESAPFRFFGDTANQTQEAFRETVGGWKTGIAVFLKINPVHFQKGTTQIRTNTAQLLRRHFQTVHVFFGLGYSELLVLTGGDNLPALLSTVTRLRNPPDQASVAGASPESEPLFVRTTTFPLVSYTQVHLRGDYDSLPGEVHPIVTVSCDPRAENQMLASLPEGMFCRNSYGESDLVLYWKSDKGVSFGKFAKSLTALRSACSGEALIGKTTTYLEIDHSQRNGPVLRKQTGAAKEPLADAELFEILKKIAPEALRASIADLVLRLSACLGDKNLEADYRDMANTFAYIKSAGLKISNADHLEGMKAGLTLTEVADLARSAINQRYAGLETHPETLAHSQSPLLCDIRTIVLASSSLPSFVFERLRETSSTQALWAGYVLFGNAYTPKWYPQNILALPATSIYRPIEEWWKITHEIAHAVFDILRPMREMSPSLRAYLIDVYNDNASHVLNEFFAHWFDWNYIYKRDTTLFLQNVWKSWLGLPIVWGQKPQYLVRTFAIVLCESLPEVTQAWKSGRKVDHLIPLFQSRWQRFREGLRGLQNMDKYFEDVSQGTVESISSPISCPSSRLWKS